VNAPATSGPTRPSRRVYLLVSLVALALVLLPFLFWYDTWFGRRLDDGRLDQYLKEANRPRRAQQALAQIGERIGRGDAAARRWYPRVVELASHTSAEMRQTTAWIMGQDRRHEPFRAPLRRLLADSSPMVRRNAALSLAGFGDPAALAELRAMLAPSTIAAPGDGTVRYRLKVGEYVNPGTLVARVGESEMRSILPGEIRRLLRPQGSAVRVGEPLVELAADQTHIWEALRGLYLVGEREDLEPVRQIARGMGVSSRIRQQAALTARQISSRGDRP